ncbi:MAG: alpha/beta fold hydrolase [Nocardiaceae bacterium]|nr:alpha/beta fold hydrolase [Nocardiaceae bacterium]
MSRLVVYVAGFGEKPGAIDPLLDRLRTEPGYGAQETTFWQYPDSVQRFTRGNLADLCRNLAERIDAYWVGKHKPDDIVLIGHSLGGLMLRYAYLQARIGLDGPKLAWAGAVSRIVLLAAQNRGFDLRRTSWWMNLALTCLGPVLHRFAADDVIAGSPFITNLRIQWIRELGVPGRKVPIVVQLRPQNDASVDPEDSRDLEKIAKGVQRMVPRATHQDIVAIDHVDEDYPGQRYDILRWAIVEPAESTEPEELPTEEAECTAVVFALHGIRSGSGDWPGGLEKHLNAGQWNLLVVTPSYGRLSAYSFALPITRRRNLRWFADQYSYYLARHPDKPFHFVGHSNGTYLLGQSLKMIQGMRFQRVFLAGSVLPRDFDWTHFADEEQVSSLVNVCANHDKPVAWLCSGLRGLGMRDIGVGGFTGFDSVPHSARQMRYLAGGHGAAVSPDRLPAVAEYVQSGKVSDEKLAGEPSTAFALVSRSAAYLLWLGLAALAGLYVVAGKMSDYGPPTVLAALVVTFIGLKVA